MNNNKNKLITIITNIIYYLLQIFNNVNNICINVLGTVLSLNITYFIYAKN